MARLRQLPAPGTETVMRANGYVGIIITGVVKRVVLPGTGVSVPGYAVVFDAIRSTTGEAELRRFLAELGVRDEQFDMFTASSGEATFVPPGARLRVVEAGAAAVSRIADASRLLLEELSQAERAVWNGKERRRVERLAIRAEVSFLREDDQRVCTNARLTSVSRSGGFVQTADQLPALRSRVTVILPIPGTAPGIEVRLSGRVVRHWEQQVEGLPGFGFVISQVDEGQHLGVFRVQLRRYGARHKATHYR